MWGNPQHPFGRLTLKLPGERAEVHVLSHTRECLLRKFPLADVSTTVRVHLDLGCVRELSAMASQSHSVRGKEWGFNDRRRGIRSSRLLLMEAKPTYKVGGPLIPTSTCHVPPPRFYAILQVSTQHISVPRQQRVGNLDTEPRNHQTASGDMSVALPLTTALVAGAPHLLALHRLPGLIIALLYKSRVQRGVVFNSCRFVYEKTNIKSVVLSSHSSWLAVRSSFKTPAQEPRCPGAPHTVHALAAWTRTLLASLAQC